MLKHSMLFDSNKKSSSVTITRDGKSITYVKGAPEKIIEKMYALSRRKGEVKELVEKNYLTTYIDAQAGRSMRLLAVAKAHGDSDDADLTLICVISIRDNVRKEAVDAIREVQNAGIQVVMVTGDRKETAVAIAREAGLLVNKEDVALTSAEMGELSDEELKKILPNLRVVSRALPTDKSRLVRIAQDLNLVVGMTGDGVNDSPALKKPMLALLWEAELKSQRKLATLQSWMTTSPPLRRPSFMAAPCLRASASSSSSSLPSMSLQF